MSQSSLTAFSPKSVQPFNSCMDCLTSLRDYRENCSAHDDGTGVDAMKEFAEKGYITPRRRA